MYQSPDITIWKGRTDPLDGEDGLRWHNLVKPLDLFAILDPVTNGISRFAFLGFCCDEGVRRNQGRIGAREGPVSIRKNLRNLAVHFDRQNIELYDAGDVLCPEDKMEVAQEMLANKVAQLLQAGYHPVVLGGGHEVAFGHFCGIHTSLQEEKSTTGIINIDAHFDLRQYDKQGNSGTPFYQISELLKSEGKDFHYMVLGVVDTGNTQALFKTADSLSVRWQPYTAVTAENSSALFDEIDSFLRNVDTAYLTLDLDVFAEAFAPGVSAPSPFGLQPEMVRLLLKKILSSGKVISMDVSELNTVLDIDMRTARLAAHLIYDAIHEWSKSLAKRDATI